MPWIRFDCSTLDDEFAIGLTGEEFKAWALFLLRVKAQGGRGRVGVTSVSVLARNWNVKQSAILSMLEKAAGRIKEVDKTWFVVNWGKYQDDHKTVTGEKGETSPFPEIEVLPSSRATLQIHHPTLQSHKDIVEAEKHFEKLWLTYPSRTGRKAALRHFLGSVKTNADLVAIDRALHNYLNCSNVQRGFVMNGSTWFNNWEDWVDPSAAMMKRNVETGGVVLPSAPRQLPSRKLSDIIISCSMCGEEHKADEPCKPKERE